MTREAKMNDKRLKRLQELNGRLDVLLGQSQRSLQDCEEIFKIVIKNNPNIKAVVQAVRERN